MEESTAPFAIVFLRSREDAEAVNELLNHRGNRLLLELNDPSDINQSPELVEFFSRKTIDRPSCIVPVIKTEDPEPDVINDQPLIEPKCEVKMEEDEDDCVIVELEIKKKRGPRGPYRKRGAAETFPVMSKNKYHKGIPKQPLIESSSMPLPLPLPATIPPQPPRVQYHYSVNNVPVSPSTFNLLASNAPNLFANQCMPSTSAFPQPSLSVTPSVIRSLPPLPPPSTSTSLPAIATHSIQDNRPAEITLDGTTSKKRARQIFIYNSKHLDDAIESVASNRQSTPPPIPGPIVPVPFVPIPTVIARLPSYCYNEIPCSSNSVKPITSSTPSNPEVYIQSEDSPVEYDEDDMLQYDENDKFLRCHLCYKWVTKKQSKLRKHIFTHLPFKKFHCRHCDFASHKERETTHHQLHEHAGDENIQVLDNSLTLAAFVMFNKRCFPRFKSRELGINRAYSNTEREDVTCVICGEEVKQSDAACHIIDCHLYTTVYDCEQCKFTTIFKRLLVIHTQASHNCDISLDIEGHILDFTDTSLFLVKSFFPSLIDKLDSNCEPELVRMETVFDVFEKIGIIQNAYFAKSRKLTSLMAKQDGCTEALHPFFDEKESCQICSRNEIDSFGWNLYDLVLHVKTHVAEGESQWCCPVDECFCSYQFKIDADHHMHIHHRENMATVVNRWNLLYPLWKEAFKKCYPSLAESGIEFPLFNLPEDQRSTQEKYAIADE